MIAKSALGACKRSWSMLQPYGDSYLRLAGATSWRWMSAAAQPVDHDMLRSSTARQSHIVSIPCKYVAQGTEAPVFQPDPASLLCQNWSFSLSFMFKGSRMKSALLQQAMQRCVAELPVLAGRAKTVDASRLGGTVVECNNAGAQLVTAEADAHSIDQLSTHTWAQHTADHKLGEFPVPFYTEPFNIEKGLQGKEPMFKVKLTRCRDGDILSVTLAHLLADGGRAARLLQRLAEHYRALATGSAVTSEQQVMHGSVLASPQCLADALEQPVQGWQPRPLDAKMTFRQWMGLPGKLYRHGTARFDMHQLFLPRTAMTRLKQIAAAHQVPGAPAISTMDAVQSFMGILTNSLCGRPLIPNDKGLLTVNADFGHGHMRLRDPRALASHFGNAVHMIQVRGYPAGHGPDDKTFPPDSPQRFQTALAANAALIRGAVDAFRRPESALQALYEQTQLVQAKKLKVAAIFMGKSDEKNASTSSVTGFPFSSIDFGFGAAKYFQVNVHPWFDLWTIITPSLGFGDGALCSTVLPAGMGEALERSCLLRTLAPETQLFLAGRVYPPK